MNTTVHVHGVVAIEIDGPRGFPDLMRHPSGDPLPPTYATTIRAFDKDGNETEFTIFANGPLRLSMAP